MFRANNFDKLLDKATSNLRLDPDWPTILQICDLIRQNDCTPKYAMAGLKKKLYSQNPHQAMFALLTLESIVKNCGSGIHDEVTSKVFCEMLRDLVKTTQHENLRTKILELIQAWAFAFRNNPKYRSVQDTVNILKAEGYKFPTLKESDAMFSADTAPDWADGEVCHRCRVAFSLMVRRHHCRACGQVFCQQCSSKTSTLPKFGIEKEVRVCDACFDKVSRPPSSTSKLEIVDTASDYGPTQPQKRPPGTKSAEELQEEEELQLALALSQSEAEHKEKERRHRSHTLPDPASLHPSASPTASSVSASPEHASAANPELSRYLDRNYWEQRVARDTNSAAPTAPAPLVASSPTEDYAKPVASKTAEEDAEDKEIDEFVSTLKSQVEIFVNRMKSNSSRGRSIANDTSVQTLFMNLTAMHSRLLRYIQQQDDKRVYLESLQDKVTQVRDSRAALDTLRAEHAARQAAAAEAAERQRQMQMASKLQAMRKKKHEYLQYQRQLALQRVQEQEREMQMRQEQQKQQYMMTSGGGGGYYMPGVSMHQFQPGYPNQPIYANPQFHPQMMPQPSTDGSVPMPGQPQMSQANMPMNVNQIGTISQSMPQLTQGYALTTPSGMALSQAQMNAQSVNQVNLRQPLGQQIPMQTQMMMQQMHQMRLAGQPGVHQMMPQNVANGLPGQSVPQQNGQQSQLPKQHQPNQPAQGPNAMAPAMPGQQNLAQPQLQSSHMMGMQMRMPLQGGQSQPQMPGYPMNMQNQQNGPLSSQIPNMQSQMQIQGQPMPLPGQMMASQSLPGQGQGLPAPGHLPNNPNLQGPHVPQSQGQAMAQPSQPQVSGPPMSMTNQMPPAQMMQGQMPSLGQQMPPQGQQMPPQGQQMPSLGQQMPPQGQQMPPQGQQMPPQGQQMPQQFPLGPGQGPPFSNAGQISNQSSAVQAGQMPQGIVQSQMPQQMPQGPPMTQGQQLPPGQQMPQQIPQGQPMQIPQGQQMQIPQGQQMQMSQGQPQNMAGQPMKMHQQNFGGAAQPPTNQQSQQAQTPGKPENNSTAELISFD